MAKGKAKPLDEAKSIETLALFISMDVVQSLQASLVRTAADLQFYWEHNFQNNPANTITYQGLAAVEERAIVHISEVLKNENSIFTLSGKLRRVLDLKFHRHALSHPVKIKWGDPEMQRFFDAKRKYRDLRAAIIWDLQRSVNEEMKRYGLTPRVETIPVSPEMGMMLSTILRLTLKPERVEPLVGGVDLHATLESLRDRWLTFLVEKSASR